jgi:hypothetical protein
VSHDPVSRSAVGDVIVCALLASQGSVVGVLVQRSVKPAVVMSLGGVVRMWSVPSLPRACDHCRSEDPRASCDVFGSPVAIRSRGLRDR